MFRLIRLIDYDRGGIIAAPHDGIAMLFVDMVGERQRPSRPLRHQLPGCRDFIEPVPEEPGVGLFYVRESDLLGEAYLHYWNSDGPDEPPWMEAPWERPWWPRLAADPRPIFIVHPPWEVFLDQRVEEFHKIRHPPPMPPDHVELVDHYYALRRQVRVG